METNQANPSLNSQKHGTFDWIVSYMELKQFFHPSITGLSQDISSQQILVCGCGTSKLSSDMVEKGGYQFVHSFDNDLDCVEHMQQRHSNDKRLNWHHYDIVERCGRDTDFFAETTKFDVVVDKGTLDAILVEGSVSPMLTEVHRLMKRDGVYIICSIHTRYFCNISFHAVLSVVWHANFPLQKVASPQFVGVTGARTNVPNI